MSDAENISGLGHRSRTFATTPLYLLPQHHFQGAGASMAILLVYAAGLIIGILVLAIVAFFLLLNDDAKDNETKR